MTKKIHIEKHFIHDIFCSKSVWRISFDMEFWKPNKVDFLCASYNVLKMNKWWKDILFGTLSSFPKLINQLRQNLILCAWIVKFSVLSDINYILHEARNEMRIFKIPSRKLFLRIIIWNLVKFVFNYFFQTGIQGKIILHWNVYSLIKFNPWAVY